MKVTCWQPSEKKQQPSNPITQTHTQRHNTTHTFPITVWFIRTSAECPAFLLHSWEAEYVRPGTRLTSRHPSFFFSNLSKRHNVFEVGRLVWVEKYLRVRETTDVYHRVGKRSQTFNWPEGQNPSQVFLVCKTNRWRCRARCICKTPCTSARWVHFLQDCKIIT